jgi:hypothetical protein
MNTLMTIPQATIEQIARVCHDTNRAYCESIGDRSQRLWFQAEMWQRESAIKGVQFSIANPDAPVSAQHEAWLKDKEADGWTYGPVKDANAKTHPCYVSYDQLPFEQRVKDFLFRAVVKAFVDAYASDRQPADGSSQ